MLSFAAVTAFITQVVGLVGTVIVDVPTVVALITGARNALNEIAAGQATPSAEFSALDAQVTDLENSWAQAIAGRV